MPNAIEYECSNGRITITNIESISYGCFGKDKVNAWVKIQYSMDNQVRSAYFADGRFLGYGGVFGGTRRILQEIQINNPDVSVTRIDESHISTQIMLLCLLLLALIRLIFF